LKNKLKPINSVYQKRWQKIKEIIQKEKLLIHQIGNDVTLNDCASIILNWGALPVMAYSSEEVSEIVINASALVLNIGTLTEMRLSSMLAAGKKANQFGIPIILDPVGVGASEYRTRSAEKITEELNISIIKGNEGEISALAGEDAEIKGVESIGNYAQIRTTVQKLAAELNTIVVVSSEIDVISNGKTTQKITGGSSLMKELVGTGCMLASTLGVFAGAAGKSDFSIFELAETAVYYYNLAAEIAAKKELTPAKFKIEFMDNIYLLQNGCLI
jgi:hydroxyethylthiazole kinase